MTYAEYEAKFRELAAKNNDPALLVSVLGEIKKDLDTAESARASADLSKKRIGELEAQVQKQKADMYDVLMGAGFRRPADQIPKPEEPSKWEELRGQEALDAFVAEKEKDNPVKEEDDNG